MKSKKAGRDPHKDPFIFRGASDEGVWPELTRSDVIDYKIKLREATKLLG